MPVAKIFGGSSLMGMVRVGGAKNAATKLLVASLLSDKTSILHNVPDIGDVQLTVQLCEAVGADIQWNKETETIEIHAADVCCSHMSCFPSMNRIPVLLLGALLSRCPSGVIVPALGGDAIGSRNLDFHFDGLSRLGAQVSYSEDGYYAVAPHGLIGAQITLPYPSVGATENLILAAVRAKGRTIIKNAALEVEILDLILFLQKIGVAITTDNHRTIAIEGCNAFYEAEHTILPDKIEAASYGMAAVVTHGRVFVENAKQELMIPFLKALRSINGGFTVYDSGIEFFYDKPLKGGIVLETDVHPGFITDWQQPFAVLLSQSIGVSVIHETVYENRLGYLRGLQQMGAGCELFYQCLSSKACRYATGHFPHSAVFHGPTPLRASSLVIPDLRAGFAYVMAALIAEGEGSLIENVQILDRGYSHWQRKLEQLGAHIHILSEELCNKD